MRRIRSAWLALASVVACATAAGAARPHYGGVLRVQAVDLSVAQARALPMVYEALTRIDADRGPQPHLARSWDSDARGARWRFRLRDDIKLHDGTTLAPWQVAAALRAIEPDWKISTDGDALVIDLPAPVADLPLQLARSTYGIGVRTASGAMAGSGPFRLEREEGGAFTLRAYDGYRDGRPFLDSIEIQTGRPLPAQLADLEAGRADLVGIHATDVRRVEQRGLAVAGSRAMNLVALIFEAHRSGEALAPVRRTLAASLNRATIADVLLQRKAEAAAGIVPRWFPGYAVPVIQSRPVLSRAAVAALPADRREFVVRVDPSDPVARAVAERVAADAREAGFSIAVQVPAGLAPRADARITTLPATVVNADRFLTGVAATIPRTNQARTTEADLLDEAVVVPIVHTQQLYAIAEHVGTWNAPAILSTGDWNLASVWLRSRRP